MFERVISMKRIIIVLTVAMLPVVATSVMADVIAWDGIVSVDTVEAAPGDHFGVKVRLSNNNLAISGLEIPLKYSGPLLTLDSVSFAETLKPDDFGGLVYQEPGQSMVKITYVPNSFVNPLPTIMTPSGVIAELFFTLSSEATSQVLSIDSVNHDTLIYAGVHWWTRIQFSDNAGENTYLPIYIPGAIIVKAPTAVGEDDGNSTLPSEFGLAQNYPNPFNPSTGWKSSMFWGSEWRPRLTAGMRPVFIK